MKVVFEKKIFKDFDNADDFLLRKVQSLIFQFESFQSLEEIKVGIDCKKMR